MAVTTVLTSLANNVGKIYQVKPGGAIDTFGNTPNTVRNILDEAVKSRIIYEAQTVDTFDFTDPVYGSTFWLNDSALAPVHDITDALEITDYLILDSRNDLLDGDIVSGSVEVTRRSRITIIPLTPEVGLTDDLISLSGDLLIGDMVVLLPKGGGATFVITIKDMDGDGVVGGNFALHNGQDITLNGTNDVCLFLKNAEAIKEIARPDSSLLDVANKTMSAGGGNYYILDPSGGAARIKTKRGIVILNGGATLAANWTVGGENGGDTPISQGTTLEVILDSELITDTAAGKSLTIFGIEIPDIYCLNYNFVVRAWYNDSDSDPLNWAWEAKMYVDQLKEPLHLLYGDAGSGEPETIFTGDPAVVSLDDGAVYAYRSLSHLEGTQATIRFFGAMVMAVAKSTSGDLVAGTGGLQGWMPNETFTNISARATCPFYDAGTGIIKGFCLVSINKTTGLVISILDSYPIDINDSIDMSPLSYVAFI